MIPLLFQMSAQRRAHEPSDLSHQVSPSREDVLGWIRCIQGEWFNRISLLRIETVLNDVFELFQGRFPGFRQCDTQYHDLEHTLRLIPPFCQIATGLAREESRPISSRAVELGLAAVLLHDSGYIRQTHDLLGTGAKYTFRHIDRSVDFSRLYLPSLGYHEADLDSVEEMIRCTGVKAELEQVDFQSHATRLMGYALGTADLLAQMADPQYLEKLPLLFREFKEAYAFEGEEQLRAWGIQPMRGAEELIQRTPLFFRHVAMCRLEAMGNLHRLLEDPATGRNAYLDMVHRHMEVISRREAPSPA